MPSMEQVAYLLPSSFFSYLLFLFTLLKIFLANFVRTDNTFKNNFKENITKIFKEQLSVKFWQTFLIQISYFC